MTGGPRSFDPCRVGTLECRAWVAYYRRDWLGVLGAAVGLVRHTFALRWPATLRGAWLVMRANRQWAPDANDPVGARETMRRFYELVRAEHGERFDPTVAARLEVEWWRLHRARQRADADAAPLIDALAALYAYVYGTAPDAVRSAAAERVAAMDLSDRWVREGRDLASPLIADERAALVRSYAALLAAVHR